MAGEEQERVEDFLLLEGYIEALQAGRVAPAPAELTPDLARIYRMALFFHAASSESAAPRPEYIAELQARLTEVAASNRAPLKQQRPGSSRERQARPPVSRRALLRTGAAAAASLAVGAGIDHILEEQKMAALIAAVGVRPPSWLPLVPAGIPTTKHFVTTLDRLGEQPVAFSAGGVVGYVIRTNGESGDPTDGPVIAMSAACTHMGCLVNWEGSNRTFRCPCHGGVFTAFGRTDSTPATIRYLAPLPRVETLIDPDGSIFVRVPSQPSSIHF